MKALRKYSLMLTALGLILLTGCEKDFDKINENPNQSIEAATPALLSQAIRDIAFNDFDVWYAGRQSSVACQHFAQRNYTSEDRYSFRVNVTDGFFRNNYIYMNNLQKIIQLNSDSLTRDKYEALYGANSMQIAVAEIVKCWGFHLLTDYFGDIPYSQALNLKEYPQPAYDTQKDVYDGLIATLNEVQDTLDALIAADVSGFSSGDLFFNGDLTKWKKFANSLRLRIALRASNADAAYLVEAQDAIADGVMEGNDDNALCAFSTSGNPNEAPWYNGFFTSGRNDFSFTYRFLELLKGNDHLTFVNPFNGFRDPRYAVYTSYTSNRNGVPYGMTDAQTSYWWNNNVLGRASRISLLARDPYIVHANFPTTFMDYPTVCFMKCEVQGWDPVEFREGIVHSLFKWGVDTVGVTTTYIDPIVTLFEAGTDEQKKEMCITQKYIHLLMQPHEAWAEYRRTGYPKSLVKPGEVTYVFPNIAGVDPDYQGLSVTFTPVGGSESGADIVARFKYPSSEYTLNKTNVDAAVARMGEDSHSQRVWWAGGGQQ